MNEFLFGVNSLLITGILFILIIFAIKVSYYIGKRKETLKSESFKNHVSGIQASMIGILALILGFTFSLSLQRFDSRSDAVVDEANAIGTTYLRAKLIPASVSGETQSLLKTYIDLRVQACDMSKIDAAEREEIIARTLKIQDELWGCAKRASDMSNTVITAIYVESLNETIDSFGRLESVAFRHVPELIFFLLFFTLVITGIVVGYSAGLDGHRPAFATYIMVTLIMILTFIIIDLDRSRRGLIKVDISNLVQLKESIDAEQSGRSR